MVVDRKADSSSYLMQHGRPSVGQSGSWHRMWPGHCHNTIQSVAGRLRRVNTGHDRIDAWTLVCKRNINRITVEQQQQQRSVTACNNTTAPSQCHYQ